MLAVSAQDARPGTPSLTAAGTISVPIATTLGAAEVPTGFPHTPEGAVGQLAAIATTVLDAMSIEETTAVYGAWSADGAPPVDTWELARAVQGFLGSAAGQYTDRPTTQVRATPGRGADQGHRRAGLGGGVRATGRPGHRGDRGAHGVGPLRPHAVGRQTDG